MITTQTLVRFIAPFSLGLGVVAPGTAAQAQVPAPLTVQVYNADGASFHVNAVLVSGKTEAVLLDTGFTRADALRIAAMVLDSKKTLKTVYISQADPDFYFGLDTLRQIFPQANYVTTAPKRKKIDASLQGKLQLWGPRLGGNASQGVSLPEVLPGATIQLEDQVIEIRGLDDPLPGRSYVWIPSIKTIAGGVNVFAGLHVWTADSPTVQERADWVKKLDGMLALQP
jgi:glyoxylase-like metal-dependent hydrolase (beta-lactamase superfamily II)